MSSIKIQHPGAEVQSPLTVGVTEALNRISEVLNLGVESLEDVKLTAVPVDMQEKNKNRIYTAADGFKLWLPDPLFKKNGVILSQSEGNFSIDLIGGSITFNGLTKPSDSDTITVTCQHIVAKSETLTTMQASIKKNKDNSDRYKGAFQTPETLRSENPSAKQGDFALTMTPPAVYIWTGSEWADARLVENLEDVYTKTQVDNLLKGKEPAITAHGSEVGDDDFYFSGRKTWLSLVSKVRSTKLTGLSTASKSAVTAADTILTAIGKLQAQIKEYVSKHYTSGSGAPTSRTAGEVGQRYANTSNGDWYTCTSAGNGSYQWEKGANDKTVSEHIQNRRNPHNVTAEQVGALKADETAVNSAKLNGLDASKYALKSALDQTNGSLTLTTRAAESAQRTANGAAQTANNALPKSEAKKFLAVVSFDSSTGTLEITGGV